MENFSIIGNWVGELSYGRNYPNEWKAKRTSFTIDIAFSDGVVIGICEDDITRELSLKPATINGAYQNKIIRFTKRYPCSVFIDNENMLQAVLSEPSFEIHYVGKLRKRLFSAERYFKGKWEIAVTYVDEYGQELNYPMEGNWIMKKIL